PRLLPPGPHHRSRGRWHRHRGLRRGGVLLAERGELPRCDRGLAHGASPSTNGGSAANRRPADQRGVTVRRSNTVAGRPLPVAVRCRDIWRQLQPGAAAVHSHRVAGQRRHAGLPLRGPGPGLTGRGTDHDHRRRVSPRAAPDRDGRPSLRRNGAGVPCDAELRQSIVLLLVIGWSFAVYSIGTNTFVQVRSPDRMQGRMVSLYSMLFIGVTPIGNVFAGIVAHFLGPAAAVWLGGALTAAGGLAVLAFLGTKRG